MYVECSIVRMQDDLCSNLAVTRHGYRTRGTRGTRRLYPHPWVRGCGYLAGTGAG